MAEKEDDTEDEDQAPPGWLTTFSDLMSLLLTFFVLLYSMSTIKLQAWDKIAHSVSTTLIPQEQREVEKISVPTVSTVTHRQGASFSYIKSILNEKFRQEGLTVDIKETADFLTVIIGENETTAKAFQPLSPSNERLVRLLTDAVMRLENVIYILGYESPVPPVENTIPDNRTLSILRAIDIANIMEQEGYKKVLQIGGLGDSYAAERLNVSLEEKEKWITRVEIRISRFTAL